MSISMEHFASAGSVSRLSPGLTGLSDVLLASSFSMSPGFGDQDVGAAEQNLILSLASWNQLDHASAAGEFGADGGNRSELSELAVSRLTKLLARVCQASMWGEAYVVAQSLGIAMELDPGLAGALAPEVMGADLARLKGAGLLILAAFGDALDGANDEDAEDSATSLDSHMRLACALHVLCQSMQVLLQHFEGSELADDLLQTEGFAQALLLAAATSQSAAAAAARTAGSTSGGAGDGSLSAAAEGAFRFAALQARRAAAELLAALLEESSPEVRARQEKSIVMDDSEPGASRLVDSLVHGRPDPKLHESLLELLWRGLRRIEASSSSSGSASASSGAGPHGASAALRRLARLVGANPLRKLQQVSAQELLDWGLDLALQLSRRGSEVVGVGGCEVVWGDLHLPECGVTFSSHSLVLEVQQEGAEPVAIEVPWAYICDPSRHIIAVSSADSPSSCARFDVDLSALRAARLLAQDVEMALGERHGYSLALEVRLPKRDGKEEGADDSAGVMAELRKLLEGPSGTPGSANGGDTAAAIANASQDSGATSCGLGSQDFATAGSRNRHTSAEGTMQPPPVPKKAAQGTVSPSPLSPVSPPPPSTVAAGSNSFTSPSWTSAQKPMGSSTAAWSPSPDIGALAAAVASAPPISTGPPAEPAPPSPKAAAPAALQLLEPATSTPPPSQSGLADEACGASRTKRAENTFAQGTPEKYAEELKGAGVDSVTALPEDSVLSTARPRRLSFGKEDCSSLASPLASSRSDDPKALATELLLDSPFATKVTEVGEESLNEGALGSKWSEIEKALRLGLVEASQDTSPVKVIEPPRVKLEPPSSPGFAASSEVELILSSQEEDVHSQSDVAGEYPIALANDVHHIQSPEAKSNAQAEAEAAAHEAKMKAEAEERAKAEAEAKAQAEAEEARLKAEAEARAVAEAEAKARAEKEAAEAAAAAALEAQMKAEAEELERAKAEAEAKAQAEAEEARLKAEAEARAVAAAEAKARAEKEAAEAAAAAAALEAQMKAEAEEQERAKAEAEAKAQAEAEQARLKAEAEARAVVAAEAKARAEKEVAEAAAAAAALEAQMKAEAEELERAKAEAEAKAQAEAEQARLKAEAEARAVAEAEAKARAEKEAAEAAVAAAALEAQMKAEAEELERAKAEAEAKAQADAQEARLKADAEARAVAEAEAKARAEKEAAEAAAAAAALEAQMKAAAEELERAKAEAEAKAQADAQEARLKAEAEARAVAEAEARAREEKDAARAAAAAAALEAQIQADAGKRAKAEAEAKAQAEAEEARLKAEAETQAEAKAKAVAEEARLAAVAEAEAEDRAVAEAQAKVRAEKEAADVAASAALEAQTRAEDEERMKVEAEEAADARLKAEAEANAMVDAEAKVEAEADVAETGAREALPHAEAVDRAKAAAQSQREAEDESDEADAEAKASVAVEAKAQAETESAEFAQAAAPLMEVDAEEKAQAEADSQSQSDAEAVRSKAEAEAMAIEEGETITKVREEPAALAATATSEAEMRSVTDLNDDGGDAPAGQTRSEVEAEMSFDADSKDEVGKDQSAELQLKAEDDAKAENKAGVSPIAAARADAQQNPSEQSEKVESCESQAAPINEMEVQGHGESEVANATMMHADADSHSDIAARVGENEVRLGFESEEGAREVSTSESVDTKGTDEAEAREEETYEKSGSHVEAKKAGEADDEDHDVVGEPHHEADADASGTFAVKVDAQKSTLGLSAAATESGLLADAETIPSLVPISRLPDMNTLAASLEHQEVERQSVPSLLDGHAPVGSEVISELSKRKEADMQEENEHDSSGDGSLEQAQASDAAEREAAEIAAHDTPSHDLQQEIQGMQRNSPAKHAEESPREAFAPRGAASQDDTPVATTGEGHSDPQMKEIVDGAGTLTEAHVADFAEGHSGIDAAGSPVMQEQRDSISSRLQMAPEEDRCVQKEIEDKPTVTKDFAKHTWKELSAMCRSRQLPANGLKRQLIARLEAYEVQALPKKKTVHESKELTQGKHVQSKENDFGDVDKKRKANENAASLADFEARASKRLMDVCRKQGLVTEDGTLESAAEPTDTEAVAAEHLDHEHQPALSSDTLSSAGEAVEPSRDIEGCPSFADLESLSLSEMRDACKMLGLAVEGRKSTLKSRLMMAADSLLSTQHSQEESQEPPVEDAGALVHDSDLAQPSAGIVPEQAIDESQHARETGALVNDLSNLPVKDLRKACEEHGLPTKGNKADLVERLTALVQNPQADPSNDAVSAPEADPVESEPFSPETRGLSIACRDSAADDGEEADLPVPSEEGSALDADEDDLPASLQGLSIDVLQAACHACGLATDGDEKSLSRRLVGFHMSQEEGVGELPSEASLGDHDVEAPQTTVASAGSERMEAEGRDVADGDVPSEAISEEGLDAPTPQGTFEAHGGSWGTSIPLGQPDQSIVSASEQPTTSEIDAEVPAAVPKDERARTDQSKMPVESESRIERVAASASWDSACKMLTGWSADAPVKARRETTAAPPAGKTDQVASSTNAQRSEPDRFASPPAPNRLRKASSHDSPDAKAHAATAGLLLLHTFELKRLCRSRNMDESGDKAQLVARLLAHFASGPPTPSPSTVPPTDTPPKNMAKAEPVKDGQDGGPHLRSKEEDRARASSTARADEPKVFQRHSLAHPEEDAGGVVQKSQTEQPIVAVHQPAPVVHVTSVPTVAPTSTSMWLVPHDDANEEKTPAKRPAPGAFEQIVLRAEEPNARASLLKRARVSKAPSVEPARQMADMWNAMGAMRVYTRPSVSAQPVRPQAPLAPAAGDAPVLKAAMPPVYAGSSVPSLLVPPPHPAGARTSALVGLQPAQKSKRATAAGTCHGWTAAGAPCRCVGSCRPKGANYSYCGKHASKWARFETVGVDQLPPQLQTATTRRPFAGASAEERPSKRPRTELAPSRALEPEVEGASADEACVSTPKRTRHAFQPRRSPRLAVRALSARPGAAAREPSSQQLKRQRQRQLGGATSIAGGQGPQRYASATASASGSSSVHQALGAASSSAAPALKVRRMAQAQAQPQQRGMLSGLAGVLPLLPA